MFFNQANKKSKRPAGKPAAARGASKRRLYSVPVWFDERAFTGEFDFNGASYKLTFAPARAAVDNHQLQLRGRLTVTDAQGRARTMDSVSAQLASIQGGMGSSPPRRPTPTVEAVGRPLQQPAGPRFTTEVTGPTSFVGVMYFHLQPLDGRALGVAADLSRVQLNVRLAPRTDTARALHTLYSAAVDAVYGDPPNEREAAAIIQELNQALAG